MVVFFVECLRERFMHLWEIKIPNSHPHPEPDDSAKFPINFPIHITGGCSGRVRGISSMLAAAAAAPLLFEVIS